MRNFFGNFRAGPIKLPHSGTISGGPNQYAHIGMVLPHFQVEQQEHPWQGKNFTQTLVFEVSMLQNLIPSAWEILCPLTAEYDNFDQNYHLARKFGYKSTLVYSTPLLVSTMII